MTLQLLNINDEVIDEKTIDFPLESVVVSGRYDKENKKVVLTLQNGTEVEFSIEDLIDGLVSQSTFDTEIQKINVEITNIKGRLDTIEEEQTTQNTEIEELREENKRLREDLNNSIITASDSGENITINDSAEARFKKLLIKGNTYQETDDTKPSPDHPSPIRNCGDNVNLLNVEDNWTYAGSTLYDANLTEGETYIVKINNPDTERTYTLKSGLNKESTNNFFVELNKNNNFTGTFICSIHENNRNKNNGIMLWSPNVHSDTYNHDEMQDLKVKIEQGTEATPYSPYGCGNMNFTVCNDNLINMDNFESNLITSRTKNSITANFKSEYANGGKAYFKLFPKKYYMSIETKPASKGCRAELYFYKNDVKIGDTMLLTTTYKFDNSDGKYDKLQIVLSNVDYIGEVTFENLMLKVDNEKTEYIPHQEQKYTFPTKEGQVFHKDDYLADDGVHQNRETVELDGEKNKFIEKHAGILTETRGFFQIRFSKKDIKGSNGDNSKCLCNYLKVSNTRIAKDTINEDCIWWEGNSTAVYFSLPFTTLEKANNYLKEQKEAGKPVMFEYKLQKEIIEPYSPEQQEVYDKIKNTAHTYKGETNIFSEDEISPEFEEEHLVDLEAYINSKLNVQASEPQQEVPSEMPSEEPSMEQPQLEETEVIGGEE